MRENLQSILRHSMHMHLSREQSGFLGAGMLAKVVTNK